MRGRGEIDIKKNGFLWLQSVQLQVSTYASTFMVDGQNLDQLCLTGRQIV